MLWVYLWAWCTLGIFGLAWGQRARVEGDHFRDARWGLVLSGRLILSNGPSTIKTRDWLVVKKWGPVSRIQSEREQERERGCLWLIWLHCITALRSSQLEHPAKRAESILRAEPHLDASHHRLMTATKHQWLSHHSQRFRALTMTSSGPLHNT